VRIVLYQPMDVTFENVEREGPPPAGSSSMPHIGVPEHPQLETPEKREV